MKYYVESQLIKVKDNLGVANENDENVYWIDRKSTLPLRKFEVRKENKTLYSVKEKLSLYFLRFEIYKGAEIIATVYQKFSLSSISFVVESVYGEMEIQWNLMKAGYKISLSGKTIASVSRYILPVKHECCVDIDNFSDEAFILALVGIISSMRR